ncbi:MAG: hypothetical protein K2Q14_06325 [Gammaproteobacteria bacterium]|nr:hypothetical protein [Gammaproteobacteria bacterium]
MVKKAIFPTDLNELPNGELIIPVHIGRTYNKKDGNLSVDCCVPQDASFEAVYKDVIAKYKPTKINVVYIYALNNFDLKKYPLHIQPKTLELLNNEPKNPGQEWVKRHHEILNSYENTTITDWKDYLNNSLTQGYFAVLLELFHSDASFRELVFKSISPIVKQLTQEAMEKKQLFKFDKNKMSMPICNAIFHLLEECAIMVAWHGGLLFIEKPNPAVSYLIKNRAFIMLMNKPILSNLLISPGVITLIGNPDLEVWMDSDLVALIKNSGFIALVNDFDLVTLIKNSKLIEPINALELKNEIKDLTEIIREINSMNKALSTKLIPFQAKIQTLYNKSKKIKLDLSQPHPANFNKPLFLPKMISDSFALEVKKEASKEITKNIINKNLFFETVEGQDTLKCVERVQEWIDITIENLSLKINLWNAEAANKKNKRTYQDCIPTLINAIQAKIENVEDIVLKHVVSVSIQMAECLVEDYNVAYDTLMQELQAGVEASLSKHGFSSSEVAHNVRRA